MISFPCWSLTPSLTSKLADDARSWRPGFPDGYLKTGKLTEENSGPAPNVGLIGSEAQVVSKS